MRSLPSGALEITHREYVNPIDIRNSAIEEPLNNKGVKILQPNRYSINPGDGGTFPWLSGIANRFEKYEFSKLRFHYYPSVSTFSQGGLALCAVYDPADPMPSGRVQLYNAETVARAAVYDTIDMTFLLKHLKGERHVRTLHHGLVDANELRSSDAGYVIAALVNTSGGVDVQFGDLFVEYTIRLNGPKISKGLSKSALHTFNVDSTHLSNRPIFITDVDTTETFDYPYSEHHAEFNTLKTSTHHVGDIGYLNENGESYDPTRMTFDEPFSGFMMMSHNGPGGLVYEVNEGTTPSDAPNRARVRNVDPGTSNNSQDTSVFAIEANAGDVVDVGATEFNTISTDWLGTVTSLMLEAAPYMVEGLVGLLA